MIQQLSFLHSKTKMHELKSVRPETNQFQKEIQNVCFINKKLIDKDLIQYLVIKYHNKTFI